MMTNKKIATSCLSVVVDDIGHSDDETWLLRYFVCDRAITSHPFLFLFNLHNFFGFFSSVIYYELYATLAQIELKDCRR